MHRISISVDPLGGWANQLTINGQRIAPQSQLMICAMSPLTEWMTDLPELLRMEINDRCEIELFSGNPLQLQMALSVLWGNADCVVKTNTFAVRQDPFGLGRRLQWLRELSTNHYPNVHLPSAPRFALIASAGAPVSVNRLLNACPDWLRAAAALGGVRGRRLPRVFIGENADAGKSDLVLIEAGDIGCSAEGAIHISCPFEKMPAALEQWAGMTVFGEYLMECRRRLEAAPSNRTFAAQSRLHLLTESEPYLRMTLPARLETGRSAQLGYEVLPEELRGRVRFQAQQPQLLSLSGTTLSALKTGNATVLALDPSSGKTLDNGTVNVFHIVRATGLKLTGPQGGYMLPGDSFAAGVTAIPANAQNLALVRWRSCDPSILTLNGKDRFTALRAGTCRIECEVEGVTQTLDVQVMQEANDIRLPTEICMRVSDPPLRVTAPCLPSGAACKSITCVTQNAAVAQWDPTSKSIVAIGTGETELLVTLLGGGGKLLAERRCNVTVLPEKGVFTPPTLPVLAIAAAAGALICFRTLFFAPLMLLATALAIAGAAVEQLALRKHRREKLHRGQRNAVMIIGTVTVLAAILRLTGTI